MQNYERESSDNQDYKVFGYSSSSSVVSDKSKDVNWKSTPMQGYGIQLASYENKSNASRFFSDLQRKGLNGLYIREAVDGNGIIKYRIIQGQYQDKKDADLALVDLEKNTRYRGLVVLLSK